MDFTSWIRQWLARHPAKAPDEASRAQYTAEVMERVRAVGPRMAGVRERSWRPWALSWPRLALVAVTAAGLAVLLVGRPPQPHGRLAEEIERQAALLAALDDPLLPATEDLEGLAQELETLDTLMVLAEAEQGSEEAWLEETLVLLEGLEEEPFWGEASELSDEEWLEELERLDERDLAAGS